MKKANVFKATVLAAGLAPAMGLAEVTGNVGASNNYVWRGVTQTNDAPSISGGVDYAHESGFYAGTWLGNVDFATAPANSLPGYEQDYYLGFSGGEDFTYDVGYIWYDYPLAEAADFGEVYAGVGFSMFSLSINYTTNSEVEDTDGSAESFVEGDLYASASAAFPLENDTELSLTVGHYAFDDDGDDIGGGQEADLNYTHYSAYISKGEFAFGVEANDAEGEFPASRGADDPRFVVSWSKSFDLM
jgi:uncharacterized protein (TIGR02001 family)